jgi:hypothetical protein
MAKSERPKTERAKKTVPPATTASPSTDAPATKTTRPRLPRRGIDQAAVAAAPAENGTNGSTAIPTYAIAFRAFELYCARGGEHGHDVEDWLRAESELQAQNQLKTATQH